MPAIGKLHEEALAATRVTVAGIAPDQWDLETPCQGWTVRELLNHLVAGNWWAAELAAGATIGSVGSRLDGDVLGSDPLGAYDGSADAAVSAFAAPGAMEAPAAVSYGPVPNSLYAGHRFLDVLVHGWDLAVATGQATRLAPDLVEACWEQVVEPQLAGLQASGAFGSALEVPADADPQVRLLAALGRQA